MPYLFGEDEREAFGYINQAASIAHGATCRRSKCGSVIVSDGIIIGGGCNTPPRDRESQRRCDCPKEQYHAKVTDKTCCVHAEQRAIMDALRTNPDKISGARLYFIRLDDEGNIQRAGLPYCTICSKMALDVGIAEFVLYHEHGVYTYDTEDYNNISFELGHHDIPSPPVA